MTVESVSTLKAEDLGFTFHVGLAANCGRSYYFFHILRASEGLTNHCSTWCHDWVTERGGLSGLPDMLFSLIQLTNYV